MAETVKCPLCGQSYERRTGHECRERQKIASEFAEQGDGGGHPDDD